MSVLELFLLKFNKVGPAGCNAGGNGSFHAVCRAAIRRQGCGTARGAFYQSAAYAESRNPLRNGHSNQQTGAHHGRLPSRARGWTAAALMRGKCFATTRRDGSLPIVTGTWRPVISSPSRASRLMSHRLCRAVCRVRRLRRTPWTGCGPRTLQTTLQVGELRAVNRELRSAGS